MEVKHSNDNIQYLDQIQGELDWDSVKQIFKEKYTLDLHDSVEFKQGTVVIHDREVAYQLQFSAKVTLSILFNRNGKCLSLETHEDCNRISEDQQENHHGKAACHQKDSFSQKASRLAEMISDINKD